MTEKYAFKRDNIFDVTLRSSGGMLLGTQSLDITVNYVISSITLIDDNNAIAMLSSYVMDDDLSLVGSYPFVYMINGVSIFQQALTFIMTLSEYSGAEVL